MALRRSALRVGPLDIKEPHQLLGNLCLILGILDRKVRQRIGAEDGRLEGAVVEELH